MTSLQYYCILGLAEIKTYAQKMQDAQVKKSLQVKNISSGLDGVTSTTQLLQASGDGAVTVETGREFQRRRGD